MIAITYPLTIHKGAKSNNIKSKLQLRLLDKLGSSDPILFHFLLPGVYEHKSTKVRVTVVSSKSIEITLFWHGTYGTSSGGTCEQRGMLASFSRKCLEAILSFACLVVLLWLGQKQWKWMFSSSSRSLSESCNCMPQLAHMWVHLKHLWTFNDGNKSTHGYVAAW